MPYVCIARLYDMRLFFRCHMITRYDASISYEVVCTILVTGYILNFLP